MSVVSVTLLKNKCSYRNRVLDKPDYLLFLNTLSIHAFLSLFMDIPADWNALPPLSPVKIPFCCKPHLSAFYLVELSPDPYSSACLPWLLSDSFMTCLFCHVFSFFQYPPQYAVNGLDYTLIFVSYSPTPMSSRLLYLCMGIFEFYILRTFFPKDTNIISQMVT